MDNIYERKNISDRCQNCFGKYYFNLWINHDTYNGKIICIYKLFYFCYNNNDYYYD
jgi:hypothetical protein